MSEKEKVLLLNLHLSISQRSSRIQVSKDMGFRVKKTDFKFQLYLGCGLGNT
jgi:hypothetical protein